MLFRLFPAGISIAVMGAAIRDERWGWAAVAAFTVLGLALKWDQLYDRDG